MNDTQKEEKVVPFAWNERITAACIPEGPIEQAQLRIDAEYDLFEQFRDWLSIIKVTGEDEETINAKFDQFLIEVAAEKFGPRLFLCPRVLKRLLRWNDEDLPSALTNLEGFMNGVVHGAKLRRGIGYGNVGPETKIAKLRLLAELRLLKQRIKGTSSFAATTLTFEDVVSIVRNDPEAFPFIWKNIRSLREFNRFDKRIVGAFITLDKSPGAFASEWLAWTYGRSPKKLDNMLGKFKK